MRLGLTAAATGLALSLGMTGAAVAKTLVYCSEGSPEGFNPQIATAGTTFDASARPIYNRLVEFERGTTKIVPGLAESWEVTSGGTLYTFKLRKGVKFQTASGFTPTRDFNADDVLFSMNPPVEDGSSLPQGLRRQVRVLQLDGLARHPGHHRQGR